MKSRGALWSNSYVSDEASIIGDDSDDSNVGQFSQFSTDSVSNIGGILESDFGMGWYDSNISSLPVMGASHIGHSVIGAVGDE